MMRLRVLVVLVAMSGSARAASLIADEFTAAAIYYGSAELFSPSGMLLSTTLAITAETGFACPGTQVDMNACGAAMAQSIAQGFADPAQAQTPPLPPVFSMDFLSQIPGLEDNNGLGTAAPPLAVSFDPNNSLTPASEALYSDLAPPAGNFALTSDTGFVPYGNQFDYVYAWMLSPLPDPTPVIVDNGDCCLTTVVGTINLQFFERDLQFTEVVAAPEPGTAWTGLADILFVIWVRIGKLWIAPRRF